jgi:nucleotide-binding universal stress UspA family protein
VGPEILIRDYKEPVMDNISKKIVIPVDGSKNSLRSLDYLELIYGPEHKLDIDLLYVLPALPPILTDKKTIDKRIRAKLNTVEQKNIQMAEKILSRAKNDLINKKFDEKRINPVYKKVEITAARDIVNRINFKHTDAVLLARRGQRDLKAFFMGSITQRILEYHPLCPVWVLGGLIHSKKVLLCVDGSKNALRAVDHAGFMLSGTDCPITIFHTLPHLRHYVPKEILVEALDLEQFWKEKAARQISPHIQKARKMLLDAGLNAQQIATKVADGSRSAAYDILKEAKDNDYGTIVIGRRGISALKEFFMGSVTGEVLHNAFGLAVWVV